MTDTIPSHHFQVGDLVLTKHHEICGYSVCQRVVPRFADPEHGPLYLATYPTRRHALVITFRGPYVIASPFRHGGYLVQRVAHHSDQFWHIAHELLTPLPPAQPAANPSHLPITKNLQK